MNTKLVEYAYPSSTTATKAGYGNKGCWFVSLYNGDSVKRAEILKYFTSKQDATNYADQLPNAYNFMNKYS